MKLAKVTFKDAALLYELLTERNSSINISHDKLPIWEEHLYFVEHHPYLEWNVIIINDEKIGAICITTQLEVGIFILRKYHGKGYGKKAVREINKKYPKLFANINPKNTKAIRMFKELGFKLIQQTYKYDRI